MQAGKQIVWSAQNKYNFTVVRPIDTPIDKFKNSKVQTVLRNKNLTHRLRNSLCLCDHLRQMLEAR